MAHAHSSASPLPTTPALRWGTPPADDWRRRAGGTFGAISAADVTRIDSTHDYWDAWPLISDRGGVYFDQADGSEVWFALAAPINDDVNIRHGIARIHMLRRVGGRFVPLGPAMPDGLCPGNREWSGSATIDSFTQRVTFCFTAAGQRGRAEPGWEQRLFACYATLDGVALTDWSAPWEIMAADGAFYRAADQIDGAPGRIKAMRDPDLFHDPADGRVWLTFTGSSASNPGTHDGVIGLGLVDADGRATPMGPLVEATGFCNELERPHIRQFDGRYYLFWCSQWTVFAGGGGTAPTALYGAVADAMPGPWRLLNGDGLVAANPPDQPMQAYSWVVLPDRRITSFVDLAGLGRRDPTDMAVARVCFGGTFAPFATLHVAGDSAWVR